MTTTDSEADVTTAALWRVQLWLGDHLIEEYVAPAELAQEYANVIQLRITGLPGRRLRCIPAEPPIALSPSPNWRDPHPVSGAR